jgi:cell wall-associated NlpC family hydrolase
MSRRPLRRSGWRVACVLPLSTAACTLVGTGVQPTSPAPPLAIEPAVTAAATVPEPAASEHELPAARVVEIALHAIGTPYRWGGTDANGFDCSGLIRFAYAAVGITLPRTSADQLRSGAPVDPAPGHLRAGDVLGFAGGPDGKADHVGLHIGDDEFIHSSSSGVRISSLRNTYWRNTLVSARRFVE